MKKKIITAIAVISFAAMTVNIADMVMNTKSIIDNHTSAISEIDSYID